MKFLKLRVMALLELSDSSVDITVEDKTTLKGAVIASTANDLNLDTGSVEYSNIFDSKKSTSIGGGVSGSGIGSTNGVSSSANINYSLSNSTQVNIATIGEGNITVRDGGSTDKLNRDTTATQIMTSDTGMKGGATVDSDTINLLTTNPVTTVDNAIDSAAGIAFKAITDGANVVNDTMVVAEKTGNLIEYKHFTTDDKVQYCLNMDDYEEKKANGGEITALDTLVYVKSKSAAGYELDRSDVSDLRLASRYVIDDATNGILENLKANIRVNSREDVNASLAVLDRFDSEDAAAARAYLAGVRESEKQEQNYALQLATDSSLRNAELGQYGQTQVIYDEQNAREQITLKSAVNLDFGADYSRAAYQNYQNGEYVQGTVNIVAGTCEAGYDTLAVYGAGRVFSAGVEGVTYLTSIEGRITTGMAAEVIQQKITNTSIEAMETPAVKYYTEYVTGAINAYTPGPPSLHTYTEFAGWLGTTVILEHADEEVYHLEK
jgi:hypothetical protein